MKKHFPFCAALIAVLLLSAPITTAEEDLLPAARTIIEAVNEGDAEKYASVFAEDAVVQRYGGSPLLQGQSKILENRKLHFKRFPNIRSEILHLAQIGQTVVMHDRVWLDDDQEPIEIVEIFEFKDGRIVQMEVIQAANI